MRLTSYHNNGTIRGALVSGDTHFDLEQSLSVLDGGRPVRDVRDFFGLADWRRDLERLARLVGTLQPLPAGRRLAAPVPEPRQLLIAGANTYSHFREAASVVNTMHPPRNPMILAKAVSSIAGPYDDIVYPPETQKLDYEVEVGLVIGKRARRISEAEVRDHVAGYVVTNEVSARDVQLAEDEDAPFFRTHFIGKSFDTFCPMGPAIATVDELGWGRPLKMRTFVNGELRQENDTTDLIHGFERLVSYISQAITLVPGDIIATGSPEGVGFFMDPPGFLVPGDEVRCEVDGIGAIVNHVIAETAARQDDAVA